MSDETEMPPIPTPTLEMPNLVNALHLIRHLAIFHWWGDAFEPVHMRSLAEIAGGALLGEPFEPLKSYKESLAAAKDKWPSLFEDPASEGAATEEKPQ